MESTEDYARKILLGDLANCSAPLSVWVQGKVQQTVGSDIIILSDDSGRAKITQCSTADGGGAMKCLKTGMYCCIIGTAISTRGLPEIRASKLVDLTTQPVMAATWHTEVREANLLLNNKIIL